MIIISEIRRTLYTFIVCNPLTTAVIATFVAIMCFAEWIIRQEKSRISEGGLSETEVQKSQGWIDEMMGVQGSMILMMIFWAVGSFFMWIFSYEG